MKHKFLIVLMAITTALCMAFGLAGCGETPSKTTGKNPPIADPSGGEQDREQDDGQDDEQDDRPASVGLQFSLNYEGTAYSVAGIGECKDAAIVIPSEYEGTPVTGIQDGAFADCDTVTEIAIPSSILSIGEDAFASCDGLTEITIPDSVTEIGARAFASCIGLSSVAIPNHITKIATSTFRLCYGLTEIVIPDSVTKIEMGAFLGCYGLTKITIPSSVTSIGFRAFDQCIRLIEIWNFSQQKIQAGKDDFTSATARNVYTDDTPSKQTATKDGLLFYEDGEENYLLGYKKYMLGYTDTETELTLPAQSPSGGNYAIYQFAFTGCKFTKVIIPNGVTAIGRSAFVSSGKLTEITIPNSVIMIGDSAFKGCKKLSMAYFENPIGWSKGEYTIESTTLNDPAKAARFLQSTNDITREE